MNIWIKHLTRSVVDRHKSNLIPRRMSQMWSLSGVERRQPHELIAIYYRLKSNIHSPIRQPLNTAEAIRKDSFTKKSIKNLSCPDSQVLNGCSSVTLCTRKWVRSKRVKYSGRQGRKEPRTGGAFWEGWGTGVIAVTLSREATGSSSNSRIRHPQVIHQKSVLLTCGILGNGTNIRWHLRTVRPTGGRIIDLQNTKSALKGKISQTKESLPNTK